MLLHKHNNKLINLQTPLYHQTLLDKCFSLIHNFMPLLKHDTSMIIREFDTFDHNLVDLPPILKIIFLCLCQLASYISYHNIH